MTGLLSGVRTKSKVIGITTSLTEKQINNINEDILVVNSYNEIGRYFQNNY